jgi:hypothetical protein
MNERSSGDLYSGSKQKKPRVEHRGRRFERKQRESACKPGSVENSHSSGTERHRSPQATYPGTARATDRFLFGLAPSGVYLPRTVAGRAVRSYRTFSPLPVRICMRTSAVCFLLHFPSARAAQALPGTLPCGARTFLPESHGDVSDCPADSGTHYIWLLSEPRG